MFRIDVQSAPRVLFTVGDADLAIAYADIEGYQVVDAQGTPADPVAVDFHGHSGLRTSRSDRRKTAPSQVSPGIYSFKLKRRTSQPSNILKGMK